MDAGNLEINVAAHAHVFKEIKDIDGMQVLKSIFPEGEANEMNMVFFSTSGVSGSYITIEQIEESLGKYKEEDELRTLTFLILHPRLVSLKYGNCLVTNLEDVVYLKKLRESSRQIAGSY
jgi:hypothetical protein